MINKIIFSNNIQPKISSGRICYNKQLLSHKNNNNIITKDTVSLQIENIRTSLVNQAIKNNHYNWYANKFENLYPELSVDYILSDKEIYNGYRNYFIFFDRSPRKVFINKDYTRLPTNIYFFKPSYNTYWNNLNNWYKDSTYLLKSNILPDVNAHVVIKNATVNNPDNTTISIQSLEAINSTINVDLNATYLIQLENTTLNSSNIESSVVLSGNSIIDSNSTITGAVELNDNSQNYGTIEHTSNVFLNDNSVNHGNIDSDAILNDNSSNLGDISGKTNCSTVGICMSKGVSETIVIDSNLTFDVTVDTITNIGSLIDDGKSYSITKDGNGTLVIDGPSKISSNIIIKDGILKLEDPNALGDAVVTIESNGTLDANNFFVNNIIFNNGNIINANNPSIFFNINGSTQPYIAPIECGFANYVGAVFENQWVGCATWSNDTHAVTSVGTNGGPSFYGTYDQIGNVSNITDSLYLDIFRLVKGYDLLRNQEIIELGGVGAKYDLELTGDDYPLHYIGFRIVSLNDTLNYNTLMNDYNDFVEVGHPNNLKDDSLVFTHGTKAGSVSYKYNISKYSITNYEYVKFLNSIDPDGINTDNIYYENMSPEIDVIHGAIIFDDSAAKGLKYSIKENWDNKPVGYVTWYECARYCNWLNNGALAYSSSYGSNSINAPHNYGAYDMFAPTIVEKSKPSLAAKYRLPTADELHKSAYYEESESFIGYHKYPTRSEKIVCVSATATGDGIIPDNCDNPPEPPVFNSCDAINSIT